LPGSATPKVGRVRAPKLGFAGGMEGRRYERRKEKERKGDGEGGEETAFEATLALHIGDAELLSVDKKKTRGIRRLEGSNCSLRRQAAVLRPRNCT